MKWTPEMDAVVKKMRRKHTRREIAEVLGLNESQVRYRITKLGVGLPPANPWTDAEVEELRRAYLAAPVNELLDLDRLAKKFKRHKTNVCRKARQLGLTDQKRRDVLQPELNKRQPVYATKEELRAATGKRMKEWIAQNGHPRGALGMRHTEAAKAAIGQKSREEWANPNSKQHSEEVRQRRSDLVLARVARGEVNKGGYSRTRGGRRADLDNVYFRSAWEANYARYLNWLKQRGEIASWEYECKTFIFEHIKRGTRAYTPDFRVVMPDGRHEWHEVKGWMDDKSKTRLARMARCYPEEKVVIVDQAWFRQVSKGPLPGLIAHWESGSVR